jgi:hypothetical protein
MKKTQRPWEKGKRSIKRRIHTRFPATRILIVCEGEKTEKLYFQAFPVDTKVIDVKVEGTGRNTESLVREAIRLRQEAKIHGEPPYNQVWCVFDRDQFPKQQFNTAFSLAKRHNIHIVYSNEAFELWYLLHFEFWIHAAHRSQYAKRLSEYLQRPYDKADLSMYATLKAKQSAAIKHAKRLLADYPTFDPEANNPSTTVHLLVEELNKHSR